MTETARNKRLDELFADEPHLSPTMKARRLHEKLEAAQANNAGWVPVVPPLPPPDAAEPKTQAMSLQRAAEILRTSADWTATTDVEIARLFRFRDTALTQWLAAAPELRREPSAGGGRNAA